MLKHLKLKLILIITMFVCIVSVTLITANNVSAATLTVSDPQALILDNTGLLDIAGPIGGATQNYIEPELLTAETNHDLLVMLPTDPPGGLETGHLLVKNQTPDWPNRILSIITAPSVAYILLLIGIFGLIFEFANPGFVLPGVAGSIALLLALYAFHFLPINYVGFALLLLGIGFMIAEVFISSFGILGLGGLIAFVVGSIFLIDSQSPNYQIAWEIITLMTVVSALFFLCLINLAVKSQRKKVVTGNTAFIGTEGVVIAVSNEELVVRVLGELWKAKTESSLGNNEIKVGDSVRVDKIEGLLLTVSPLPK
jgi:membrane-bound serine protease (ClpP class)